MSLLEIKDVNFTYNGKNPPYKNFAIRDFSADVEKGDFISVIGKNGSGKSTIIKLIARIYLPDSGAISYCGKNISEYSRKHYSKLVSYLPQSVEINENLKVKEFLMLGRYAHKKFTDFAFSNDDNATVSAAIETMSSEELTGKDMNSLSGGERQKVLITLSLVQLDVTKSLQEKVLIIDEPMTHLDINHQLEIFGLLKRLNENGLTIIVIMHDMNLAMTFSNKSMLIDKGELAAYSDVKNVITEEMLKEYFLINSKIVNFEKNYFINYIPG